MMGSMTRRLCVIAMCLVFAAQAEARPRPKPVKVQNSIRGATMMAVAPWGLTAQGHRVNGAGWMRGGPGGWGRQGGREAILGLQATDGSFQGPSPLLSTTAGIQALAGRPWPWLAAGQWRLWLPLLARGR